MLHGPQLSTILQVESQESRVEGQNTSLTPFPMILLMQARMIGFLGYKCTLPAGVEFSSNQSPKVLLLRDALNSFSVQPVCVLQIVPVQVQDLALVLVELLEVCTDPLLKPAKFPIDGIPSLLNVDCTKKYSA